MKVYKGESMNKYGKVWRLRTCCHRRWIDPARQEKKRRGVLCPSIIMLEINNYMN